MHRWFHALVVVGGTLAAGCGGESDPGPTPVNSGAGTDTGPGDTGASDTGSGDTGSDTGGDTGAGSDTGTVRDAADAADADACPETCVPGKCIPCIK